MKRLFFVALTGTAIPTFWLSRRSLLPGVMRTATTDDHALRWFRRYRTLGVGSGAHVLVNGVLDVTREMADARSKERLNPS